jgi:NAD(P)H-quinone oxidoreductase subunit 6
VTTEWVGTLVFYLLAALAIGGGLQVALGRNIVHGAFALLATFLGVAGLYACLGSDLVAVVQLLVYVGGVLVLILFAVMLTARISDVNLSNGSRGMVAGVGAVLCLTCSTIWVALRFPWEDQPTSPAGPTTSAVGDALLGPYVLPFEVISFLLLAALIGAVTIARGPLGMRAPAGKEGTP